MIRSSECWKFIEPVADLGFFEEEVVEHLFTGQRGLRRSYNDKISADPVVCAEIARQAGMLARVSHPAVARVFTAERVGEFQTVVYEYVVGPRLDDRARAGEFQQPARWSQIAAGIVEAFIGLSAEGVDWTRVRPTHFILGGSGAVRLTTPWCFGTVARDIRERSAFFSRLGSSSLGGYFVADEFPDPIANRKALAQLLYFFASGVLDRSIEQAYREDNGATGRALGIEKPIADTILALYGHESASGHFNDLREAVRAIEALRSIVTASPSSIDRTAGAGVLNSPASRTGPAAIPSSASRLTGFDPGPRQSAAPAAAPPAPTTLLTKSPPPPPASSGPRLSDVEKAAMANRNAKDDDVEDLYPERPDAVGTGSEPASARTSVAGVRQLPKAISPTAILVRRLAATAVVIVVAGVSAALIFQRPAKKDNRPPMAVITSAPATGKILTKLKLDGSGSSDPDGNALSYTWAVVDPPKASYRILPNREASAVQAEAQFFDSGTYVVELKVWDGVTFSSPVTTTIEVTR